MNPDRWRMYFAAAIAAASTVERHNSDAMAVRAADIADAMMRVDEQRWPAPKKPEPTSVPSAGTPRQDSKRRG